MNIDKWPSRLLLGLLWAFWGTEATAQLRPVIYEQDLQGLMAAQRGVAAQRHRFVSVAQADSVMAAAARQLPRPAVLRQVALTGYACVYLKYQAEMQMLRFMRDDRKDDLGHAKALRYSDSARFYMHAAHAAYALIADSYIRKDLAQNGGLDRSSMDEAKRDADRLYNMVRSARIEAMVADDRPEARVQGIPTFPWPPPRASAMQVVPASAFHGVRRLGEVDKRLSRALDACQYGEKSYYAVPGGFALVARMEQINPDGSPKPPPDRWSAKVAPMRDFSLADYLRALFTSNPGYFRIIVFVVTPQPFSQSTETASLATAMNWLATGLNTLPESLARQRYAVNVKCTALIYEFEQPESGREASLRLPGRLTGQAHLEKSDLWRWIVSR